MQESRYASCNAITSAVQIPANIMQSGTEQLAQPAASSQQEELRMSAVEAQQALNECGTSRARLLGLVGRLGVDISAVNARTPTSSIRQMIQDRIALMQRVEQSMTED